MTVQGIIFDMDGLMFDTEKVGYKHMLNIVSANGYDMPKSVLNKTIGVNKKTAIQIFKKYLGKSFPAERLLQEKRKIVNIDLEKNGVPVKEGLYEILSYLEENNIKKAVATSSYREVVENVLQKTNVYKRFDTIVCGDEIKNNRIKTFINVLIRLFVVMK